MNQPTMFRQGDVLIRRVAPQRIATAKHGSPLDIYQQHRFKSYERDAQGRIVLAYGEVTGHAHAILDPGVIAWSLPDNKLLLDVPEGGATVVHEEHAPIPLEPGAYEVVRQREWTDNEAQRFAYVAD